MFFSTKNDMSGEDIVRIYKARFQIEFVFRSAKQSTGLCRCQARDKSKLKFAFNASLSTVNIAKETIRRMGIDMSVQKLKLVITNIFMLDRFISTYGVRPNVKLNNQIFKDLDLMEMTASVEGMDNSQLKTYYTPKDDENTSFTCNWSDGDVYKLSDGSAIAEFSNEGQNPLTKFVKTADVTMSTTQGTVYTALYPAGFYTGFGSETYTLSLPQTQEYVKGKLANNAYPMLAKYENVNGENSVHLKFYHLASMVVVRVKTSSAFNYVTSITLKADQPLSGGATAKMDENGMPLLTMDNDGEETVTLNCHNAKVNSDAYTSFAIVIPPGEYTNFTATVNYATADGDGNTSLEENFGTHEFPRSTSTKIVRDNIVGYFTIAKGNTEDEGAKSGTSAD